MQALSLESVFVESQHLTMSARKFVPLFWPEMATLRGICPPPREAGDKSVCPCPNLRGGKKARKAFTVLLVYVVVQVLSVRTAREFVKFMHVTNVSKMIQVTMSQCK